MRLTEHQQKSIVKNAKLVFGESSRVYLFGSRVDDSKRGGDIDLFIECDREHNSFHNKVEFTSSLYQDIGEQRIDVVLKTIDEADDRLVVREALSKGVLL